MRRTGLEYRPPKRGVLATVTEHKGRQTRRSFAEDYKTAAVRLVLDEGKTVART